ncbi:hypothetical protein pb186bvf_012016 [Paramecium bursaria]
MNESIAPLFDDVGYNKDLIIKKNQQEKLLKNINYNYYEKFICNYVIEYKQFTTLNSFKMQDQLKKFTPKHFNISNVLQMTYDNQSSSSSSLNIKINNFNDYIH